MDITSASGAEGPGSIPGGCIFSRSENLLTPILNPVDKQEIVACPYQRTRRLHSNPSSASMISRGSARLV